MNDPILSLQAKLDQAKSSQDVSSDILEIQKQLDNLKLQAEIDPQSISALNVQLDHILEQKIKVIDIEINENQVQQIGQSIGRTIGSNITDGIRKSSGEITSEIEKNGKEIENIQPSPTGFNKIIEFFRNFELGTRVVDNFQNIGKCRMSVRISKYCCCFEYALHA